MKKNMPWKAWKKKYFVLEKSDQTSVRTLDFIFLSQSFI